MHELFSTVHNGIPSKVSWFRLFKHMDDDGSGLISFKEFEGMVREELLLGEKELPVKQLVRRTGLEPQPSRLEIDLPLTRASPALGSRPRLKR